VAEFLHERRNFDQLLAVVANESALDKSWRSLRFGVAQFAELRQF
jgi:hypothetical protein